MREHVEPGADAPRHELRDEGRFVDETHLRRVIDKMVGLVGRRIDESSPYVDARLPDGSRINAVISPLCVNGGPYLTVRKFSPDPYQADDLVTFGTMSAKVAKFLATAVGGVPEALGAAPDGPSSVR